MQLGRRLHTIFHDDYLASAQLPFHTAGGNFFGAYAARHRARADQSSGPLTSTR